MPARYAIYYAPAPGSSLEAAGAGWLGWNPTTAKEVEPAPLAGLAEARQLELVASPRHYGFHATLKAPFRLADGSDENDLKRAAADFAGRMLPFFMPPLALGVLGGFVALLPSARSDELHDLADACVKAFEPFRAPPEAEEIQRRDPQRMTQRQRMLLAQWGYPYVFDEYRFHMTLTGRAEPEELARLMPGLDARFQPALALPLEIDAITLFWQPDLDQPFRVLSRMEFGQTRALAG